MKTSPSFLLKKTRNGAAFTLVEVIFSLGIISFSMVGMMGLLSVGIQTFHKAINTTTETQIVQQLANDLSLASYSVISKNTEQPSYYTQEGIAIDSSESSKAIYLASISAPTKLYVPYDTNSVTVYPATNTLTFVISVWSKSDPKNVSKFPIQIANDGS